MARSKGLNIKTIYIDVGRLHQLCGVMKLPGSSLEQQGERRESGDYQSTVRGGLGKEGLLDGSCGL